MDNQVVVRAYRDAVRVPGAPAPHDTVHLTVRHPALPASTDAQRMSGMLEVDRTRAPHPVVVVLGGVNVASAGYTWLAVELVRSGFVAVTYDWVGELFPGQVGLTPGVDVGVATPEAYGSAPTTPALRPLLDRLHQLNGSGALAGMLDLTRVVLLGHSAGGTVALQSASSDWFPELSAVVTYGSHLMASTQLGFAPDTIVESPATVPVLLVSGAQDGVVRASAVRYGQSGDDTTHDPVLRTWSEALSHSKEAWLAVISGAGHLLVSTPEDQSSARGFLETPLTADQDELRQTFIGLLTAFLGTHVLQLPAAQADLDHYFSTPPLHFAELRRR
ncbi:hypothetical protein [Nocardioides gilvus]|uniref:hypothetical protein n=1 Tax=Nocardioides gilvus TaxID=1735589 RepID=UPI0013A541AA|nr:hypothetical protein [Nocardioides gilvus]